MSRTCYENHDGDSGRIRLYVQGSLLVEELVANIRIPGRK
jgi:hypothetical protein